MRCHEARKLLAQCVDDTIDSKDSRALDQHCRSCQECAEFRLQINDVWQALEAYPVIIPNATFKQDFEKGLQILERAPATSSVSWRPQVGWQWMALATLAVMLAVFISVHSPLVRTKTPPADLTKTDHWDDTFLNDLELSLTSSAVSYLPAYDSWPTPLPDSLSEDKNPAPDERNRRARRNRS